MGRKREKRNERGLERSREPGRKSSWRLECGIQVDLEERIREFRVRNWVETWEKGAGRWGRKSQTFL